MGRTFVERCSYSNEIIENARIDRLRQGIAGEDRLVDGECLIDLLVLLMLLEFQAFRDQLLFQVLDLNAEVRARRS